MTRMSWLPDGKRAAVCLSVDDVHPSPVAAEALGHVQWLQERHPQLSVTLFTTPDWRTLDPLVAGAAHPRGTFRLDVHESFCAFLRDWPAAEVAMHGLHHVSRGPRPVLEFDGLDAAACHTIIGEASALFGRARLPAPRGMSPPGWHATPALLEAMGLAGLTFIASARDLDTPITPQALANGSGLTGVSLLHPQRVDHGLVHFPTNFQATSTLDRATAIIECGGLLSIKAHLLAECGSYRALDGLTPAYRDHLDRVLSTVEDRFGDTVWWTSMGEIAG